MGKPPSLDVASTVRSVTYAEGYTRLLERICCIWFGFFYECLGCFMVVCDGLLGFGVELGFDSKMTLY